MVVGEAWRESWWTAASADPGRSSNVRTQLGEWFL